MKDGVVDCIATFHKPHNWDEKVKELQYAEFGIAGMEVAWQMLIKANLISMRHLKSQRISKILGKKLSTSSKVYKEFLFK